jgi:hypothetical protein
MISTNPPRVAARPTRSIPRIVRALRITWTALCGIACLLLVVLWVRSYWYGTAFTCTLYNSKVCSIVSFKGTLSVALADAEYNLDAYTMGLSEHHSESFSPLKSHWGIGVKQSPTSTIRSEFVSVPHWFAVVLCAICAITVVVSPEWHWRFRIRTLLIATTLVAVGLGLIVWLTR